MKKVLLALALVGLIVPASFADGTSDGVAGGAYGSPVASDAVGASPEGGPLGPNTILDLADLYIFEDTSDVFFCMTIAADIGATDWGKYCFLIESDGLGAGATTSAWDRLITTDGVGLNHQIQFCSWVDGGGGFEIYSYDGAAWNKIADSYTPISIGETFGFSANGNGGNGGVEMSLPKSVLGNPTNIKVEAVATGGNTNDSAYDTIPNDTNPTSWNAPTVLTTPTSPVTVPVELSAFGLE